MRCLLIYDISHDGARTKVADACLDYGLTRVQYSAFIGELNASHQRELFLKIRRCIGKRQANVQLFLLNEQCWTSRRVLEQEGT